MKGHADDSLLPDVSQKIFFAISISICVEAKRKVQSDSDNLSDAEKVFHSCVNEDDRFHIDGMKGSMMLQISLSIPTKAKWRNYRYVIE